MAWDGYCRTADAKRNLANIEFGRCLAPLAYRVPAEAAGKCIQQILQRLPNEKRSYHRELLRKTYSVLLRRVPASQVRQVMELAEQRGITEAVGQTRSQRDRTVGDRPTTIEDLATPERRGVRLRDYFRSHRHLKLEERLKLLRELDERGFLSLPDGTSFEPYLLDWFRMEPVPDSPEAILRELGQPDCVGLKQRLLTVALAKKHDRDVESELWELVELFPTQD
jgi:hypothetical protein